MSNIPIFLPSDNNYAPFLATAIASICSNTDFFCNFYILDSGITPENQEKICELRNKFTNFSIEFLKINIKEHFKSFKVPGYLNISTYNRLLIPQLKPNLDKVLYLDSDIVVLDDISELFSVDLGEYALGAAWEASRKLYNTDTKGLMGLSDDYKYFNAGVLLISIKKWNENNILNKLFEIEKEYGRNVLHADETLLNKYFDNNYKIFDIKYNYTDYDVLNSPNSEVVVRHFATPMKPWNSNFSFLEKKVVPLKNFDDFWKYAQMTSFCEQMKNTYSDSINSNVLIKRFSAIINRKG